MKKKIGIGVIGLGGRGSSLIRPLCKTNLADRAELKAVFDESAERRRVLDLWLKREAPAPVCVAESRRDMLAHDVDLVLVCTPQSSHADHVCVVLEGGHAAFTEKPMAISVAQCDRMIETSSRTGRPLFMGFNVRHNAVARTMKKLIVEGRVGKPQSITCTEFFPGGYSYFRRWHRFRKNSGGLLVEKGCHSLDLINWFADSRPARVAAFGGLDKFLPRADSGRYCHACARTNECPYTLDVEAAELRVRAESGMDTHLDRNMDLCVFNSDKDTHDNTNLIIEYENRCRATYVESFTTRIRETRGRNFIINGTAGQMYAQLEERRITCYPETSGSAGPVVYDVPPEPGGHGGADENMLAYMLDCLEGRRENREMRPEFGREAVRVATAADESIASGRIVDLLSGSSPGRA